MAHSSSLTKSIEKTWSELGGHLVFTVWMPTHYTPASITRIHIQCHNHSANEIILSTDQVRSINLVFPCGCYVRGYLVQRFQYAANGDGILGIFADIRFSDKKSPEIPFMGNIAVHEYSGNSPQPDPFPILPDTDASGISWISSPGCDLFPYIYMRKWPQVDSDTQSFRFVPYIPPPDSDNSFYQALCKARDSGRGAMQDLALGFIQGSTDYAEKFIAKPTQLSGAIQQFPRILSILKASNYNPTASRTAILEELKFQDAAALEAYLVSDEYQQQLAAVWQSYFALIIILGYHYRQLFYLTRTLVVAWLLDFLFPQKPQEKPLTRRQLKCLAKASILLPEPAFPLPPAGPIPEVARSLPGGRGWIEPYAIGDLHIVRQRLLRYLPGEVAHIETVMRGERKELSSRQVDQETRYDAQQSHQDRDLSESTNDQRSDLVAQSRQAVIESQTDHSYQDLQTSYGPPTQGTLNGSYSVTEKQGDKPGVRDRTDFAREVTNNTINRIQRHVTHMRNSGHIHLRENTVRRVIDNRQNTNHLNCIFRWINKIYQAVVVDYGNRLIIEFMLINPASHYIQEQQWLDDQRLERPQPPTTNGIQSFKDITAQNYATLTAHYQVTGIEPPPKPTRTVSAALRAGDEKLLAIPGGYCAHDAQVKIVNLPSDTSSPVVLVGQNVFKNTDGNTAAENLDNSYGQDTAIAVSVLAGEPNAEPETTNSALFTDVIVNVDVICNCTEHTLDTWRIQVFDALQQSYQQQLDQYLAASGARNNLSGPAQSPLAHRDIERLTLRRGCEYLLFETALSKTGIQGDDASQPPAYWVNEPRYQQFFSEIFEWQEMTYSFYDNTLLNLQASASKPDSTNLQISEDPLFSRFLNARQARVLVPARPSHSMALIYFLSSGALWDGKNSLAPVNACDVTVVSELKSVSYCERSRQKPLGKPWELTVPTTLQVIDEQPLFSEGTQHA